MRGPSWWLLRDYAICNKRLSSFGSSYSLDAGRIFEWTALMKNNLMDIHADDNLFGMGDETIKVHALNRKGAIRRLCISSS